VLYNISNAVVSTNHLEELIGIIREQLGTLLDTTNFFIALYDEKTGMLKSPLTSDQKDTITTWSAEKSLTGHVIKNNKSLLVTKAKKEEMRLAGEIELIGTPSEVWLGVPLHLDGEVIGAFAVQSYDNPNAYTEKDVEMLEFVSHQISISIQRKKTEDDIKDALKKAEESDKLKTAFLNNMSHEIRTPLNGIMGFSGLLDEPGITSEERQYYTRIIHQNGNQLTSIIEAIINIATIEAGLDEIHENPINLNSLLNNLFNSFSMLVNQQSVLLNYKTNLTYSEAGIFTDENKLRQILSNLIGNSVKFTNTGKIEFGCNLKNGFLEFYVSDTGIGIKPEDHEVIFERFRKINPDRSREYGGNGLGLTISKAYIELLGGKIWFESAPGKGSRFYFTLPYNPQKAIIDKNITIAEVPVEKVKVKTLLVAEDEYSNYQLLEVILLREKHRIIHVVNGVEAVEACRENPAIDMVLMDLKMPEMDGFQATTIIKSEKPNLPIIAVTAFALSGDKEKALEAGCNEYISKPIKRSDLVEIINKY
jgi:signal transduction histidine kinase